MTPQEFARECTRRAQALRALPRELHQALDRQTTPRVAEPLAGRVRTAGRGVYATRVAGTTTVRVTGGHPEIVVGGTRRIASGGATGRDLVWGNEFGGGRRPRTRQFIRNHAPFVVATIERSLDWAFDRWTGITDDVLNRSEVTRG